MNIGVIQRMAPDVIGFQEVQADNLAIYERELDEYDYLPGPSTSSEGSNFNAIFWKPSRLIHVESYGYWLSETPDVPSFGWGAADMRAMFSIRFKLLDGGQEFVSVNTHLDHRIEGARVENAKLIIHKLSKFGYDSLPIILTGDFNCNPGSTTHQFLQEHGFVDVYHATGHEDIDYPEEGDIDSAYSNTVHAYGWTKPSSSGAKRTGPMRFDWILLLDEKGKIQPIACEIVRDAQPPLYPSDHYPVMADFEIC